MILVAWKKPQRTLPYFYQKNFHFLTKSLTTAYLPERKMFHMIPASDESGPHGCDVARGRAGERGQQRLFKVRGVTGR
ncbi:hypothetical protein [Paraburkholderia sp. BCC1876]|uniref:hypothetical protein n=1 Tax=Paraburkholderia sp. BCC1876 TaxID=2676303 RepID=UPI00158FE02F|nr:hypothetical protein [Paraburkholderia sp. BCC1876]